MNFATEVVDARPSDALAIVSLSREGERREWSFGEVADRASRLAGGLQQHGVRRGDVVMTLIGNRPEWVIAMVACFRIGAVALPCTEQLRAKDLRMRIEVAGVRLVLADDRNLDELVAGGGEVPVVPISEPSIWRGAPAEPAELEAEDPCLLTFTSGTTGAPQAVLHGQRYLSGQRLQAEHWLGAGPSDLVWCTAATGWSKSARNVFVAPWLRGAASLLQDARFDPEERLDILERERVTILCMAPTEYRVIAKRSEPRPLPHLSSLVAAGEALDATTAAAWREATGVDVRDGYGQTETGQLTANPLGTPARPGSMGLPLPGIDLQVRDGELVLADPATDPTFFLGYLGKEAPTGAWRTGDLVEVDEDGYLYFSGRNDDVIISSGYRIGPFEVESALIGHPAVAEAAVVGTDDEERGSVVHAFVVLREGWTPSDSLTRDLQAHAKETTAPYKYPRLVTFADTLPRTATGKVRRVALRELPRGG